MGYVYLLGFECSNMQNWNTDIVHYYYYFGLINDAWVWVPANRLTTRNLAAHDGSIFSGNIYLHHKSAEYSDTLHRRPVKNAAMYIHQMIHLCLKKNIIIII